jgi:hypothetical protein
MSETPGTPNSTTKLRWARAQRFRLTGNGTNAIRAWKEAVQVGQQGRSAFDTARAAWAVTHAVEADDGLVLSELSGAPLKLEEMMKSLADTGVSREEVKDRLERLHTAGLVEPVPAGAS